jgi:hypothetical protein
VAPEKGNNRSYDKLRRDLEDEAELPDCNSPYPLLYSSFNLLPVLPYKRATFVPQSEISEADPERILYSDLNEEKADSGSTSL